MSAIASVAVTDPKILYKTLYRARPTPQLIDVPELACLAVDGLGAPDEGAGAPATAFQEAIQALYPVAYTLKFGLKKDGIASSVMPLEALWQAGDGGILDPSVPPADWAWKAFIVVSPVVDDVRFAAAVAEVGAKRRPASLALVHLEHPREGRCAQVMHIGPYSAERPTIEAMLAFIAGQGLVPAGPHHEIYLGDPRQADPAKLKTILRQPVADRP